MNTYLTIMVTVLVTTQIIRITQNHISLRRQRKIIERDVAWLKVRDITEDDFDTQREAYQLLRDHLLYLERKRDSEQKGAGHDIRRIQETR